MHGGWANVDLGFVMRYRQRTRGERVAKWWRRHSGFLLVFTFSLSFP